MIKLLVIFLAGIGGGGGHMAPWRSTDFPICKRWEERDPRCQYPEPEGTPVPSPSPSREPKR